MKFNRHQWTALIVVAIIKFFFSTTISFQAPFYPAEAERRGATATEYGFVFSVFELTSFIVSLVAGKIVGKYGLRSLMVGGMMVESTALILFGLLDLIQNRVLFIALSMILRVMEGAGGTVAVVTGLSAIAIVFPDDFSTIFGTMEIFFGVGLTVGPILGGSLYSIGGFKFPFISVGAVGFIISCSFLIIYRAAENTVVSPQKKSSDILPVLKVPGITLNLVCLTMLMTSAGFYSTLLEPHLRQFNLSALKTSLFFIIYGVTYAIVAPIFGKCLDTGFEPKIVMIVGFIFVICGYTIIGPAPFLPYHATIASCIVALILQGFAYGACITSGITGVFSSARKSGLSTNTPEISTLLNGLWSASSGIGCFIGPTISGILYDLVGFRWATQFIAGSFVILTIVMVCFTVATELKRREEKLVLSNDTEESALLLH